MEKMQYKGWTIFADEEYFGMIGASKPSEPAIQYFESVQEAKTWIDLMEVK
jgi:hypothetical protein